MVLSAVALGVEVVVVEVGLPVVVEVVVEVAGIVEVLVGDAVGWGVATNPCELCVDVVGVEVVVVLRGVELWGAFGAVADVVDPNKDPLLSVAPFVLEAMVDVVEVG
ncbi:MAG: hypothetical protein ABSH29_25985 [Acidimicrobiales bacterium]